MKLEMNGKNQQLLLSHFVAASMCTSVRMIFSFPGKHSVDLVIWNLHSFANIFITVLVHKLYILFLNNFTFPFAFSFAVQVRASVIFLTSIFLIL